LCCCASHLCCCSPHLYCCALQFCDCWSKLRFPLDQLALVLFGCNLRGAEAFLFFSLHIASYPDVRLGLLSNLKLSRHTGQENQAKRICINA
jgi:hypothetical protein